MVNFNPNISGTTLNSKSIKRSSHYIQNKLLKYTPHKKSGLKFKDTENIKWKDKTIHATQTLSERKLIELC